MKRADYHFSTYLSRIRHILQLHAIAMRRLVHYLMLPSFQMIRSFRLLVALWTQINCKAQSEIYKCGITHSQSVRVKISVLLQGIGDFFLMINYTKQNRA